MSPDGRFPRKVAVCGLLLLIAATCASSTTTTTTTTRERRHVGGGELVSSNRPDDGTTRASGSRSFKSSAGKNNEITTEPGRKVSHRLIGGHLRAEDAKPRGGKERSEDGSFWDDDGMLMSSAGNGKGEGKSGTRPDEDDEKKTLSQQVKEGKYGLIQNEIYSDRPKRPGIISYLGNPEVPKDTVESLGGLDEEDIWLAENHVLVLRGGKFPGHETQNNLENGQTWPPIDNYQAPKRQVKIPARPKIPPPFPVQLAEDGPIQIIGPNGTTEIQNGTVTDYSADPLYGKGVLPGELPFFGIPPNATLFEPDFLDSLKNFTDKPVNGSYDEKKTKAEPLPPGFPPFYHALPPGAVFLPPPSNQTDYDEEDQSIYYPPPYSFQYHLDNSSAVPPGPLVPGIILPPPPDFFSALEEKKGTTKKYTKRPGTTPLPRSRPTYLPPRKLTTKDKSSTSLPIVVTKGLSSSTKSYDRASYKATTYKDNVGSTLRNHQRTVPFVEVTTLAPEKPTTLENTEFYGITPVVGNQVSETTTDHKTRTWSTLMNRKPISVLSYFPTTTASSVERPVEVTPASIKNIVTTTQPGRVPNQASYFFYEESTDVTSTPSPESPVYYRTTTQSPSYYKVEEQASQDPEKKQYYSVESVPSQETSKDYSVKLIDSLVKDPQVYRYSEGDSGSSTPSKYEVDSGRTQSQRMLADEEAPVYYQPISRLPVVQPYYSTPKPRTYYRQSEQQRSRYSYTQGTKPKPIYQYSFQSAAYPKRTNSQRAYYEQRPQQQQQVGYEFQDLRNADRQYDYEDNSQAGLQRELQIETFPYKTQGPIYPATTARPVIKVTPNPHHAYFTQQDEKLLDDVTKEYFTIFGKKLPNSVPSTTPIYGKHSGITEKPNYNGYVTNDYNRGQSASYKTPNVKVHYGDQSHRPYSLKDDTLVNYKNPLPPINPDSEFISIVEPKRRQQVQQSPIQNYRVQPSYQVVQGQEKEQLTPIRGATSQRVVQQINRPPSNYVFEEGQVVYGGSRPLSLLNDTAVNYADPRPPLNPDAEYIDVVAGGAPDDRQEKSNAYIAYRLPGDGGHFYFLTPQAVAAQRQDESEGYLYPKPRGPRLLRRRRRPGNV